MGHQNAPRLSRAHCDCTLQRKYVLEDDHHAKHGSGRPRTRLVLESGYDEDAH